MKNSRRITKKSSREFNEYKNMVRSKTEDEFTDDNPLFNDLRGTNEINPNSIINDRTEKKIQEPPIGYKFKDLLENYSTQILIGALVTLFSWSMGLQIGQAIQDEKIKHLEDEKEKIQSLIDEKYVMKDIYDIQIDNLKEKLEEIKDEVNSVKEKK